MTALLVLLVLLPAAAAVAAAWSPARAVRPMAVAAAGLTAAGAVWAALTVGSGSYRALFGELPWLEGIADSVCSGCSSTRCTDAAARRHCDRLPHRALLDRLPLDRQPRPRHPGG
jgi:hypothetical protein